MNYLLKKYCLSEKANISFFHMYFKTVLLIKKSFLKSTGTYVYIYIYIYIYIHAYIHIYMYIHMHA